MNIFGFDNSQSCTKIHGFIIDYAKGYMPLDECVSSIEREARAWNLDSEKLANQIHKLLLVKRVDQAKRLATAVGGRQTRAWVLWAKSSVRMLVIVSLLTAFLNLLSWLTGFTP